MRVRPGKILRGLGRILLGLVLLVGVLWVLRVPLFGGWVKDAVTHRLEDALGGRYEIEGVGGTWITGLRLDGLRTIESPAEGPLTAVSFDSVEVTYDPLGLLGAEPLAAIERVRVVGGRLDLDLTRPASEAPSEMPDLEALEAFRGTVDVALDVVVETGEGPASVRGLHAAFGPGRPLELAVAEIVLPERLDVRGPFAGRVERVDADSWRWTSTAEIGGVRVPEATITRGGRVTATVEIAGGRIDVEAGDEEATVHAASLDLAHLPAWVVGLLPEDVPAPTSGRSSGSGAYRWGGDEPGASFDLEVEDLVWREERVSRAGLRGRWTRGRRVTIAEADVTGDGLLVRGRDVVLDLDLPFFLRSARALEIDVESLRAFVPELERDAAVSLRASSPDGDVLSIERLTVRGGGDVLEVQGAIRAPEDLEAWRRSTVDLELSGHVADPAPLELPWTGRVTVRGTISGSLESLVLDLGLDGEDAAVDGRRVDGARLQGTLRWPEAEVEKLELRAPGLTVDASGHVSIEPFRFSDVTWRLEIDELAEVAPLLPETVPALAGRLRTEGTLSWSGEVLSGSANVSASGLRVDGEEVGALTVVVEGDGEGPLLVRSLDASGPWGRVRGAASVDLAGRTVDVEALDVEAEGVRVFLREPLHVAWDEDEDAPQIRVEGADLDVDGARVRFDATVRPDARTVEMARGSYESEDLRVRLSEALSVAWTDDRISVPALAVTIDDDLEVRASLAVDLEAETATVSSLVVHGEDLDGRLRAPLHVARRDDVILVRDLDAVVQDVRVRGAAEVRPDDSVATLAGLRVTKDDVDARFEAPVRLAWGDETVSAEGLDVSVLGGRVRGRASWDGALHADLEAQAFPLARWVDVLDGRVSARVRVEGERLAVRAEVGDLAFQEWRGAFLVEVAQGEKGPLRVNRVLLRGPGGHALEGDATLPFRLSTDGLVRLDDARATLALRGALGGLDLFTGVADGPVTLTASGDGDGLDVRLRIADVGLCDETQPCDDVMLDLRVAPDRVDGRIALASDAFVRVRGHLSLDRGFDWTRPEGLADLVASANVDCRVDALVESWAPLAGIMPGLRRLEGGTRLVFAAKGPLRSPSVDGTLTMSQVGIELDTDVAPFEQVDARLVWKDDLIRVEQLEGLMGFAPFAIQGTVRLPPDALPVLDLTLSGRNTQLIRTEWFRMRIDMDGRITGPVDSLHIEGEGRVVDSIYREPVSLTGASGSGETAELILFEIDEYPFSQMTFDVGIQADDTIRIRNNLLKVNVGFEGRLKGTGARPAFEGRAVFQNAVITLPLTTLRNGRGEIEFLAGSPGRPRIQVTTRTRIKGYEMGLQLSGRLPDVNLHVFTEPPLDDEDAMLMLATGSTGAELAAGGIMGKALSGVASVFGSSLFTSRGDAGAPGQKSFFERFEISADLNGTDIREVDAEFELERRYFLHVKRDRFDATNLGLIWRMRFR